jgi:hypothetical protein
LSLPKFFHHLYCPKYILSGQIDEWPWLKRNFFHNCRRKWSGYMMKPKGKERYEVSLL